MPFKIGDILYNKKLDLKCLVYEVPIEEHQIELTCELFYKCYMYHNGKVLIIDWQDIERGQYVLVGSKPFLQSMILRYLTNLISYIRSI